MTTLTDAIKAALDANWSGAGGAEPTLYNTEDITLSPLATNEWILVMGTTQHTRVVQVNNKYVNEFHSLNIRCNTDTSEDRLDEIMTEVERILNTNAVLTGYDYVAFTAINRTVREQKRKVYTADMSVEVMDFLVAR